MQSKIFAAIAGAALVVASFGAQAMPTGAIEGRANAFPVTRVAEGCGPDMRLTPAGRCRRIRGAVVVAPRPVVVVPRVVVAPRPVVVVAPRPPVVVAPRVVVGPRVVAPRRHVIGRPRCGVHVPGITVTTRC